MELIFKIYEQPGRPPVVRKLEGDRITIGRAFDNDLILTDGAVSPHHAVIEKDDTGELVLRDLDSLNGIYGDRSRRVEGSAGLASGAEFLFGKTPVRIFSPDHPVVEAVSIGETRALTEFLDRPVVLIGAVVLVTLIHAVEQWLNMFDEFKWQDVVNIELVVLGSALLTGIFWSVIGRIFRHETNFRKQITVILVFVAAQFLLSKFFEFLLFNTLDYYFSLAIMLLIEFVLIATLLWFNLLLATSQTSRQRKRTAVIVSLLLIALSLYAETSFSPEFSDTPEYVKVLDPPVLRFARPVSENDFLSSMTVVFDRLESD